MSGRPEMPNAMPNAAAEREAGRLTPRAFRAFQDARPDTERWELIDGTPVMMTPPSLAHNRIASNLERALNDALEAHDPGKEAVQRPGIELALDPQALPPNLAARLRAYRPEPDVAIVDHAPAPGRRFVSRAYLLAEILSDADAAGAPAPADDERLVAGGARWIDVKTRLYRAHAPCTAVLVVEQTRIAARLWRRTGDGEGRGDGDGGLWREEILAGADAPLDLAAFGLRCALGALYAGTWLRPRRG